MAFGHSLRASRRASWVSFCQSRKVDQDFIPLHVYWKGRHRPTRGRPNHLAVGDIENTAVPGARDPVPLACTTFPVPTGTSLTSATFTVAIVLLLSCLMPRQLACPGSWQTSCKRNGS